MEGDGPYQFDADGGDGGYNIRDEVLVWQDNRQEWVVVGKMKMARSLHGITSIHVNDPVMEFCT